MSRPVLDELDMTAQLPLLGRSHTSLNSKSMLVDELVINLQATCGSREFHRAGFAR